MNTESRLSQHRFMDSVTNIVIGEVKRNYRFDKRVDVKIQREKSAIHVILKRFRDYFEVLISKEGNIDIIVQGIGLTALFVIAIISGRTLTITMNFFCRSRKT